MSTPALEQAQQPDPQRRLAALRARLEPTEKLPPLLLGTTMLALLALTLAQLPLHTQQLTAGALLGLLLGLLLWGTALLVLRPDEDQLGELAPAARLSLRRWLMLGGALLASAATWLQTGENVYRAPAVLAWLLAMGLWFAAWWPAATASARTPEQRAERRRALLLLGAITLIGSFFRFYQLSETPYEPTSDHAEKLMDVNDLVQGQRPIFFERNTGREPLQFYLTFALIKLFGLPTSYETLKLGTALVDTLAIPAVYLLASELRGRRTGLVAALLYAISQWPVTIARVGLRFPYGPLPTALTLWALLRYMRTGDRRDALLCGLFIGVGLHGYSPFRVVVLVVPLVFVLLLLFDRRQRARWHSLIGHGLLIGATAAIIFLPLLHFMQTKPAMFWERAATRTLGEYDIRIADSTTEALLKYPGLFLNNNLNALLAFNWKGDSTQVNFLTFEPFLDYVTAALLLAGLLVALWMLLRRRSLRFAALLLAIPPLLLSTTLSLAWPGENPSINRMGTVAPVIFTIAALPFGLLWERLRQARQGRLLPILPLFLGAMLLLAARQNYVRFFHDFHEMYKSTSINLRGAVQAIRDAAPQGVDPSHAYHVSFPHWLDTRNIGIALGDFSWGDTNVVLDDRPFVSPGDGKPLLFVLHRDDELHKSLFQQRWPEGVLTHVPSQYEGQDFYTFYVPPGAQEQFVAELELHRTSLTLDGAEVILSHPILDEGSPVDIFDGNPDTLIRRLGASPFVLELSFPTPRQLSGIALTTATMDFEVTLTVTSPDQPAPQSATSSFSGQPADPTVELALPTGPALVSSLRLEINHLNENPPHVHVRELQLKP